MTDITMSERANHLRYKLMDLEGITNDMLTVTLPDETKAAALCARAFARIDKSVAELTHMLDTLEKLGYTK